MDVALRDVHFKRGGRFVLDVPELRFASGRTTALLGPNGSGKSSLLRLVAALDRPGVGAVTIGGERIEAGRPIRERVAVALQQAVFVAGSVRSNLDLGLRLRGVAGHERARRIGEVAGACGIAHLLGRNAALLSGGERQRANLARALCLRAPVTLLDEPLSGLDGPAREQLLDDLPGLLRAFAATTIVVTHDRREALRLGDDVVVLMAGRVRAAGPRAAVFGQPPDAETAAFLGYTLLQGEGGTLAVAPGALTAGPGEVCFGMSVDEVVDLGVGREARGTIGGVRAAVSLPESLAVDAGTLLVSAPASAVRRF
ncbi:MAG: ABC transporter ATP-binding protein [Chloroflexi bacterium]|nr:ABC transporter ATP-binding protein [Chloroflexota bacterium]